MGEYNRIKFRTLRSMHNKSIMQRNTIEKRNLLKCDYYNNWNFIGCKRCKEEGCPVWKRFEEAEEKPNDKVQP